MTSAINWGQTLAFNQDTQLLSRVMYISQARLVDSGLIHLGSSNGEARARAQCSAASSSPICKHKPEHMHMHTHANQSPHACSLLPLMNPAGPLPPLKTT
jgi:hypothetical protein